MTTLDQHGQPVNLADLAEPQTARTASIRRHLVDSQIAGLTPERAAAVLRNADAGYLADQTRLFDDMLDRDAHLRAEFEKRTGTLGTLDWRIAPPVDASAREKKTAAYVEDLIKNALDDFEDVILHLMEAVGYGFSAVELEWTRLGGEWIPKFHPRPQTWFVPDETRTAFGLAGGLYGEGGSFEPLIPMGWIQHVARKVKTGYLGRAGLLRGALWPFMYKAFSIGDFAEFLEIYGLPIIVGKYMPGANEAEKASLMAAVSALGRDARAIMPDGMALEIQSVTGSGSGGSRHLDMVDWADRSQSKLILGQVLSAEARSTGLGSGVADFQAEVRRDILQSDARQLAATLTRDLVYPLAALNRGGVENLRRCPRFEFDLGEAEDLKLFSEALPALAAGGAKIPVSWVHEKLRIPEAAGDEPVFGAVPEPEAMPDVDPSPPGRGQGEGRGAAALAALAIKAESAPTLDERLTGRLDTAAAPEVAAWLDTVRAMLDTSDSLEEFRQRLFTAWPELDRGQLVEAMTEALAAAHLWGMSDVDDET